MGKRDAKGRRIGKVSNNSALFIAGASGYVGKVLFEKAKKDRLAYGTSSSGGNGLLPLRLDTPADFDYGKIRSGDVVLLTAAISAPDVCAREHGPGGRGQ